MNTIFLNNKYTRWYWAIIAQRAITDGRRRHETHHIIPRSLGGSDEPGNLVRLTPRGHFICHWLLTKMTIGDDRVKMIRAFWMMRAVNQNQERYINSRAYESLKSEYARLQSESMTGENNPNFGKFWTEEQKLAQADKVRGDKNGMKSDEARAVMKALKTGVPRGEFTPEWIENLRKANSGEGNGMHGKSHTDKSKTQMKESASLKAWVNNGVTSERVNKTDVQQYLNNGWLRGRHYVVRGPRGTYKKKQAA
jgi:hypothetical protein